MKVLIYGAGAVGLGLASCLLLRLRSGQVKSRVEVCLVARPNTVRELRQGGLSRSGIFGRFHAEPEIFSAYESLDEIGNRNFDFILVCTKSFDSAAAAEDLSRHPGLFGQHTKIVLCQNGWGNAEKFIVHFPKERIYSARVITGFTRHKPNEVEITVHADAIHIGSLFGCDITCMEALAKAIAEGGIPCVTVPDIEKDLWAKMLYNCALNPLGAILDVPYGALAENPHSRDLMNRIIEEVFAVMLVAGFQTHWQSAEGFLKVFYDKLVPDTASHKSSTLQDIAAGKKTEIDALTGAVLALADKYRIEVPYCRSVYAIIKFVEAGR
ncbi:MAG: 2-dehydropantoate 2-reductase [Sedimentisphaerales bacterium]|nr:2-dehydropantoate 2-reductase [Sedimentisphaerales bacterium]